MTKRMLIDGTHPEEIRVVVTDGKRLDEYDVETSTKKQLKGNIYLAKVTRVEPSLQAAFVDYGGNRHGFLAFNEIHPDYYQIPIADREALLAEHEEMERRAEAAQAHVDEIDGGLDVDEEEVSKGDSEMELDEITAAKDNDEPDSADDQPNLANNFEFDQEVDEAAGLVAESIGVSGANVVAQPLDDGMVSKADRESQRIDPADAAQPIDPADAEQPVINEIANDGERQHRSPKRYRIQEVIKRRQILLVQVVKEERGNKGAALTTFISLAGRYSVLMPNTARGGGISRKITNATSRRKLRKILGELEIPTGMGVIMRTAGMERNKSEIKRDLDYLLRAWVEVRELTLQSTAPTLVYEEANLIKRAIRDLYAKDTQEILVDGADAYQTAKKFMRLLMPSHAKRVQPYRDGGIPLFFRYQVEGQLDAMHSPVVQLKSGGYIVIHSTEALVAIDVNSGRATRARNIEETAHRTNIEAAEEVARQLRLRDLAGLIVIDFIDMEEARNTRAVERKVRDSMKDDRARIQIGRISGFGLLELSRQRLRPSLIETSTEACPHCEGTGFLRSTESMAMHVLRAIEEEGIRNRSGEILVNVATAVAIYILNQKRAALVEIENRYSFVVNISANSEIMPSEMRLDLIQGKSAEAIELQAVSIEGVVEEVEIHDTATKSTGDKVQNLKSGEAGAKRKPRRRRTRKKPAAEKAGAVSAKPPAADDSNLEANEAVPAVDGEINVGATDEGADGEKRDPKRRRRGRRGGRRRSRRGEQVEGEATVAADSEPVNENIPTSSEPSIVFDESAPGSEAVVSAQATDDSTREPPFEIASRAAASVDGAPVDAKISGDNTYGEAISNEDTKLDDQLTNVGARVGEPVTSTDPVADVQPKVAADRPRRKGWWQKPVE